MEDKKELKDRSSTEASKKLIRTLIKQLHEGRNPEEVKVKFRNVLRNVSPSEVAQIEQELVIEGMPQEEIRKLCDVHLAIFRESLDKQKVEVETDHPIHVFMEEHKIILQHIEELKSMIHEVDGAQSFEEINEKISKFKRVSEHLMEAEKHNLREENVLFPYLQKHGITEPPAIMWSEHNELKKKKKQLLELLKTHGKLAFQDFAKQLADIGSYLIEELSNHIYKENRILYPIALQSIKDEEWKEIKEQCDELGYCCFTPKYLRIGEEDMEKEEKSALKGIMDFEIGSLKKNEIEAIFNALPVDVTFVDAQQTVRYFNEAEGRIFPRTKAVIGRKVQQCHPPKSVHIVNRVLEDLKQGRRKSADFWINMDERKIYIRYFPVRSQEGEFLGCLEVTQDITDIQKIKDERRLLDEIQSK